MRCYARRVTTDTYETLRSVPLFAALDDDALATPGSKDSFDGNCAGCHFTGYQLAKNGGGEEIADAVNDINGAVDFDGDGAMDEINSSITQKNFNKKK